METTTLVLLIVLLTGAVGLTFGALLMLVLADRSQRRVAVVQAQPAPQQTTTLLS